MRESTLNPLCTITKITPTINKKIGCRRTVTHSSNQPPHTPPSTPTHINGFLKVASQLSPNYHSQPTHWHTHTSPPFLHTHNTDNSWLLFPNHLATLHHFRFRSSGNPAFSCPPHFSVLSLIHSLSVSPIILHTSHTLFCREVHNPNSRSRCGLAGKRTQNLRAILLLLG
jgi:hypothetical protein